MARKALRRRVRPARRKRPGRVDWLPADPETLARLNTKYRCAGCKQYMDAPPHRRVGLGGVCSDECHATVVGRNKFQRHTKPMPRRKMSAKQDEVPTTVRQAVTRRDRGRCRWCGSPATHLHHINYRSEGVDHQPHNLITLCVKHHDVVHSNKHVWKPVLLATIWYSYSGRSVTVPQVHRWLNLPNNA